MLIFYLILVETVILVNDKKSAWHGFEEGYLVLFFYFFLWQYFELEELIR